MKPEEVILFVAEMRENPVRLNYLSQQHQVIHGVFPELDRLRTENQELRRHLLTAWLWLSGRHKYGGGQDDPVSLMRRLEKAETEIATAAEWEELFPEGPRRFVSEALQEVEIK